MFKLLCPHCYKNVSFPESAAGTDAPCPECGKPFPIPAKYYAMVGPAPVPLPPVPVPLPPAPEPEPTPAPVPAVAVPSLGYTHSRGITISPLVVGWIPAAALTAILLLTFFPWVEVAPGGNSVYTQGAWRAITGRPTQNIPLEELMMKDLPPPLLFDRTSADWLIMLPYVLTLLLAAVVAWADRLESPAIKKGVPSMWPHRHALLAGLAGAALLFLALEMTRGFGLERALNAAVSEKFAEQRTKAGNAAGELKKIDFSESQELAKYGMERTSWLCLAMGLHVLVLLAMLGQIGLARRGNKPPPRIAIHY